jgi:hypothetical protein
MAVTRAGRNKYCPAFLENTSIEAVAFCVHSIVHFEAEIVARYKASLVRVVSI